MVDGDVNSCLLNDINSVNLYIYIRIKYKDSMDSFRFSTKVFLRFGDKMQSNTCAEMQSGIPGLSSLSSFQAPT